MKINKKDIKIETMRGQGSGGQHRNKTDSCVRATHLPTGISVIIDGRNQHQNKKKALKELERRLVELKEEERAAVKKEHRDYKIHNTERIRTYNYDKGIVVDHRTGKKASLKEVLGKGRLDLLQDLPRRMTLEEFRNESA